MSVRIAELQSDDLPVLREMYLHIRRATFTWLDTSHYELDALDTDIKDEYTLVARADNIVVGFVSAYAPDNFIHHLYVHQLYQNQGIGKSLLNAILEKMNYRASLKCLEANEAGVAFYTKCGFVEKKKGVSVEGVYVLMEYNADN